MCNDYLQKPHNSREEIEPEAGTRLQADCGSDSEAEVRCTGARRVVSEYSYKSWFVFNLE